MSDLLKLFKDKEKRDQEAKIKAAQDLAREIFEQLKEKNLQVSDAMLTIKFLQDAVQNLSGKKIQEMYLTHL